MQIIDIDGKVLFEDESETIRETVENAVRAGVKLQRANFVKAGLQKVDFWGAYLRGADFTDVNLRESDFRGANLREVKFQRADLRGGRFWGANLLCAEITESQIPDIIAGLGLRVSKDGEESEE